MKTKLRIIISILVASFALLLGFSFITERVPYSAANHETMMQTYQEEVVLQFIDMMIPKYYEYKNAIKNAEETMDPASVFFVNSNLTEQEKNIVNERFNRSLGTYPKEIAYTIFDCSDSSKRYGYREEWLSNYIESSQKRLNGAFLDISFDANGIMGNVVSSSLQGEIYERLTQRLREIFQTDVYDTNNTYSTNLKILPEGEYREVLLPRNTRFVFYLPQQYFEYTEQISTSFLVRGILDSLVLLSIVTLFYIYYIYYRQAKYQCEEELYRLLEKIPLEFPCIMFFGIFVYLINVNPYASTISTGLIHIVYFTLCTLYTLYGIWLYKNKKEVKQQFFTITYLQTLQTLDLKDELRKKVIKLLFIQCILISIISFTFGFGWIFAGIYTCFLYLYIMKYLSKSQKHYQTLLSLTNQIASGVEYEQLEEKSLGIFESIKPDLMNLQTSFHKAIENAVHSQKMKTELITNVSHDLKTPLTSIISYLELLKNPSLTDEERNNYMEIMSKSSNQLKLLIDDIFEISKANSKTMKLENTKFDICALIEQVLVEHREKLEKKQLDVRFEKALDHVICYLDAHKVQRIFDNLIMNIAKYAMPSTRVYIELYVKESFVHICCCNISEAEITLSGEELLQRFVQGEASRTREGSGLGLSIVSSFCEVQKGSCDVIVDRDLFKVYLTLPYDQEETDND